MKRRYLILSMIVCLMVGTVSAFAMECETPPFVTTTVEPNILIIFDNSGSMLTTIWIEGYDKSVDHSSWRLPVGADEVVFLREKDTCYMDHCWVAYDPDTKHVKLRYHKPTEGSTDICSGDGWTSRWSATDGYFYFDRVERKFITKSEYNNNQTNRIKIFLPYATYSVGVEPSNADYTTWYDYDYMNWLFYESTQSERDALKQQHDDPEQRAQLTRVLVAKRVIKDLVETTDNVRFGFMDFNGNSGGSLKAEVTPDSSDKQAVLDAIDKTWGTGSTPLAETLEDAWEYFSGAGTGTWGTADSPIKWWCQKNFIILMTDGYPSLDANELTTLNKDWDGDGGGSECPNGEEDCYHGNGSDYMDDIAYYLYKNDLFPTTMEGKQNVYTYTIGFTVTNPLLKDTAFNGNGLAGLQGEWDNPLSPHYHRYFYMANNYAELKEALEATMVEIINKISSGTAVAVQSTSTQGQKRLLRAKFLPNEWRGYLEAFKLPYKQGDQPLWEAGQALEKRDHSTRHIFTAMDQKNGKDVKMNLKVPFTEANSATEDADGQKLYELLGAAGQDADEKNAEAKKIISYIRGDSVAGYRERTGWKLGDIAYSSPVIWENMAYVGANDGMLHAFDINTGEEKWAFIPNNLLPKLKDLARMDYCHEYFVDLSPKMAEIYVGGERKTVLVGGERAGGKSFFALDISDPSPDGVKPMWEFSHDYLGESWTFPAIAKCKFNVGVKWVAFVGSGFENKDDKGYIFAVDVETGEMITDKRELKVKGSSLPSLRAIDLDRDGYTDRIYVGSFDEGEVLVVHMDPDPQKITDRIFKSDSGQPITVPMSLSLIEKDGQTYVGAYVGTGKYYTDADKTDLTVQSFYCLIDNGVARGRGGLAPQTNLGVCEPLHDRFGWYIDFFDEDGNPAGERVISSSFIAGGYVFFTTFQPSEDPCQAGGIARLYCVNYDDGCVPDDPVIDINGDGEFDDGDKDNGTVPRSIEIRYGLPSDIIFDPAENTIIIQTSDTTIHQFKVNVGSEKLTVHSWREVID